MGFRKNADGLIEHDGTRSAEYLATKVGGNVLNKLTLNIIGEDLVDNPAATDATKATWVRGAVIPSGAILKNAKLYVTEAFTSSGAATLDIGTYNADTGAAVVADGIDADIALSSVLDTVGEEVTCDGTQVAKAAGATALAANSIIVASYETAAFTAGAARLEVEYIVPQNS